MVISRKMSVFKLTKISRLRGCYQRYNLPKSILPISIKFQRKRGLIEVAHHENEGLPIPD